MSEKELVRGCQREDKACQETLFQLYAGKMLSVARRYARHDMEAEDLLQDAFIKVFDNIEKFGFKGSLEGWIRRIVVNTALKNYQKHSYQKEQIGLGDYEGMKNQSTKPEVFAQLGAEELMKIISQLPDGYRIIFNMYAIEGYSHKEIAEMLEIKEGTSRSQLVKARRLLQIKILSIQSITTKYE